MRDFSIGTTPELYCWKDSHKTTRSRTLLHTYSKQKIILAIHLASILTRLVETFAGHQNLGLAIDDWIERKMGQKDDTLFWDFELCLISRSTRAKGYLLKAKDETGVITEYQAGYLLQGWGMQDEEAAAALIKFANSAVAKHAADILPDILQDKELCRRRLLEMLREESEFIDRRALIGMTKLGADELDDEVAEVVVNKYTGEALSRTVFRGVE